MEKETKNMLIGAFATGAVGTGLESYYVVTPGLRGTFPYLTIHEALPALDAIIASAGTPLVLYALGKVTKKNALIDMAKGGAIYGISELLGITLYRVAMIANGTPVLTYGIAR